MENKLGEVIVKPLINRLGTIVAAFLIATIGTDATLASEIGTAVVALALLCVDLINSNRARRDIKAKAIDDLIETKFDNRGR